VLCKDFYAEEIAEEQDPNYTGEMFLYNEFKNTTIDWVCPNIKKIRLWNDPYNY
jgi:hypothetical protein